MSVAGGPDTPGGDDRDDAQWLTAALHRLAEDDTAPLELRGVDTAQVAVGAGRRARRRRWLRVAGPLAIVVVAVAIGVPILVGRSSSSGAVRVSTASSAATSRQAVPGVGRRPVPVPTTPGSTAGVAPETLRGWSVTALPVGVTYQARNDESLDYTSKAPAQPGCSGKPAVAVTIYRPPSFSLAEAVVGADTVEVAGAPAYVQSNQGTGGPCQAEVTLLFQPRSDTIVQVATTQGGVAAALLVARGLRFTG